MNAELSISVVRGEDLTPRERDEWLALCSKAFGIDYEPFARTFRDPTHVIARVGGVATSHALWVTRWLQPGDLPPLRTAYIEAVATEAMYRRRGLATAVMRALQAHISDYHLGGLSPGEPCLYMPLGWEFWRGPLFIRTEGGLMTGSDDRVMVLRLRCTPPLDLDAPLSAEWRDGELW